MKPTSGVLALAMLVVVGGVAHAEKTPMSVALERKGFEQIAHRKGVKVYKHKYDSNIRLGADASINAPVSEVFKAVMNYEGQVGKIARLSESRVLQRGKGWLTVYQRLNLPVISDRDFTLKVRWGKTRRHNLGELQGPAPRCRPSAAAWSASRTTRGAGSSAHPRRAGHPGPLSGQHRHVRLAAQVAGAIRLRQGGARALHGHPQDGLHPKLCGAQNVQRTAPDRPGLAAAAGCPGRCTGG